jgi:RimJ/RimL family protein N-acetyltransferase
MTENETLLLRTERLDLVAASVAHHEAELGSSRELGDLLGAIVPEGWPPGEYDRPAIEFFRDRLAEDPSAVGWLAWYAVRRPEGRGEPVVVASGGYFGPPDGEGSVEVGYSVLPEFQGRGYATEIVRALVDRALSRPEIARVFARAQEANAASVKVLLRCGFVVYGPAEEPGLVRFVRTRGTKTPAP